MAEDDDRPPSSASSRPSDDGGEKPEVDKGKTPRRPPQAGSLSDDALDLQERMRRLADGMSGSSTLGTIAGRIADQQEAIEGMRSNLERFAMPRLPDPLTLPEVEIPEHPAHETNERLERIEARFEQILGIAAEAAAIANGLQAAAAEFLVKFERAAGDNDRAARRAIWIGVVAVAIAVLAPLTQIVYTEFRRVPADTAAMQGALAEMKTEIAGLKEEQAKVADRLAATLENADRESAVILRDIRDLLGSMEGAPPGSPPVEPAPDR